MKGRIMTRLLNRRLKKSAVGREFGKGFKGVQVVVQIGEGALNNSSSWS